MLHRKTCLLVVWEGILFLTSLRDSYDLTTPGDSSSLQCVCYGKSRSLLHLDRYALAKRKDNIGATWQAKHQIQGRATSITVALRIPLPQSALLTVRCSYQSRLRVSHQRCRLFTQLRHERARAKHCAISALSQDCPWHQPWWRRKVHCRHNWIEHLPFYSEHKECCRWPP